MKGQTTTLTYQSSPDGLYGLHRHLPDGSENIHYLHTDHTSTALSTGLGSWTAVTDETGTVVDEQSYDVWGNRRDPATWTSYNYTPPEPKYDRGFTGHEHLDGFQLINMNGRMYDPVVSRMLAPDNFVQTPDFSQNFNRYSYALNNPLMFTDPSGKFLFAGITALFDFAETIFTKGGLEFWNWNKDYFQNAWSDFDPSAEWSKTNKAFKIDMGLFKSDPNKTFGGRVLEILSRFTWQAPQTLLGYSGSVIHNLLGGVKSVVYYGGATVVESYSEGWGGITLGSYINGAKGITADPDNRLFQHEYGHYLQSQTSGWFYLSKYGIPSALSKDSHNQHPAEQDANVRAFKYFNKHIDGYSGWLHTGLNNNAMNGYDPSLPYNDPANQAALRDGRLNLDWFDYLLGPQIIIPGLINAFVLNSRY